MGHSIFHNVCCSPENTALTNFNIKGKKGLAVVNLKVLKDATDEDRHCNDVYGLTYSNIPLCSIDLENTFPFLPRQGHHLILKQMGTQSQTRTSTSA